MLKPYHRVPFIFNYSTLILLALAFVIAQCKKDERLARESTSVPMTSDFRHR